MPQTTNKAHMICALQYMPKKSLALLRPVRRGLWKTTVQPTNTRSWLARRHFDKIMGKYGWSGEKRI